MVWTGNASMKPWWMAGSVDLDTFKGRHGGNDAITAQTVVDMVPELSSRWSKRDMGFYSPNRAEWFRCPGRAVIVHEKTGTVTGVATEDWQERQVAEELAFLDRFARDGELLLHTAGILDNYERAWLLAQTPIRYSVKQASGRMDEHVQFLLITLDFTGKGANVIAPTDVRVVCANTERLAVKGSPLVQRITHRGSMDAKYAAARRALESVYEATAVVQAENQSLANRPMDIKAVIEFSTSVFLDIDGERSEIETKVAEWFAKASDRSKSILRNKVSAVAKLYRQGIGNEGVSAYDTLQAFTEYFDHADLSSYRGAADRTRGVGKAISSAFDGHGADVKSRVRQRLLATR
jgi:phage/plasmid-like protein (TIGR03299 family)